MRIRSTQDRDLYNPHTPGLGALGLGTFAGVGGGGGEVVPVSRAGGTGVAAGVRGVGPGATVASVEPGGGSVGTGTESTVGSP
jgi:hypothetical protein